MWNLKNSTNELIYKRNRITDVEKKTCGYQGGMVRRDKLGDWD